MKDKTEQIGTRFSQSRQDFIMYRRPWFSISSLRIGRNFPRFKSQRQFLRRTVPGKLHRAEFRGPASSCYVAIVERPEDVLDAIAGAPPMAARESQFRRAVRRTAALRRSEERRPTMRIFHRGQTAESEIP